MLMTEPAQSKWLELLDKLELPQDTLLRLAIKGGGCSGFKKKLDYCPSGEVTEEDMVTEHGMVKAVVDMKSLLYLSDATIDYFDGLMGAGFTIDIPSAKNSCGCGESFSV
jgi:iron-sulfur cluster assembly accessory protein